MIEKGQAAHWPTATITEIEVERAWYRQSLSNE
jgi:hypothetical protein